MARCAASASLPALLRLQVDFHRQSAGMYQCGHDGIFAVVLGLPMLSGMALIASRGPHLGSQARALPPALFWFHLQIGFIRLERLFSTFCTTGAGAACNHLSPISDGQTSLWFKVVETE